jgi:hypothetical protein
MAKKNEMKNKLNGELEVKDFTVDKNKDGTIMICAGNLIVLYIRKENNGTVRMWSPSRQIDKEVYSKQNILDEIDINAVSGLSREVA